MIEFKNHVIENDRSLNISMFQILLVMVGCPSAFLLGLETNYA